MSAVATEMTLRAALAALGVKDDTLTPEEKGRIDRDGYIIFERLFTRATAKRLADQLDELAAIEGEKAGTDFHTEPGTVRLGNLMNKTEAFDILYLHPKVLAVVDYMTHGNFGISSVTGRAAMPGEGAQGFHVDFKHQNEQGVWVPSAGISANALLACDDFTEANGATRLVPGTYLCGKAPEDVMKNPKDPHPDEKRFIVPAGSVLIIDGATWHSGTRNTTDKPRHIVSVMCQPRGKYQDFAYRKISRATASRLSDAALFVLDHTVE